MAAPSVSTSGSQAATVTTEHDLASITTAGAYALAVDCANLQNGTTPDIVEFRVYGKAASTDTERLMDMHRLMGAQSCPLWMSKFYPSPHHIRFTLKQGTGTSRSFPWAVYAVS